MKCPQCDFENEEGSKFCKNCNVLLSKPDYSEDNPYTKKNIDEEEKIRKKIQREEEIRAEVRVGMAKKEKEKKALSPIATIGYLVLLALGIIIYNFLSKPSTPTKKVALITPEIKQEIRNLEGESKNDLFTFTDIVEGNDSVTVKMKLLFEPKSKDEVQFLTDLACAACHKILREHGIDYFIHVWGYKPTEKEGQVLMYGETSYNKYTSKLTFESKME
jgi:hypothetical protein